MLTYTGSEGKTFEERMAEAIADIPLYTDEWTNFNPSDPGITILETLLGFGTLQQESMGDIPFRVKQNLLKLVGFEIGKGKSARVLLSAENVRETTVIPANHKFTIGELVFETNREIILEDRRILGVYGKKASEESGYEDFGFLTDKETRLPALIFGEKPAEGDCLYFIANKLPEPGKELTMYFTISERINRNPFDQNTDRLFADIEWEAFCDTGWVKLDVRDSTSAFLQSGEVRLWMPESPAAVFEGAPESGYAIRARLTRSEYDVRPKLTGVWGFLFEVWQKDTICECHSESKTGEIDLYSEMSEEAYIDVYCREGKGESYRKYYYSPDPDENGRFYDIIRQGYGHNLIRFDKRRHGYGAEKGRDCVKIVIYTEDVARQYALGRVLGYDMQEIKLPYTHIVPHSFCIIARRYDENGNELYDFVRPERKDEGALYYHLLENDGKVIIEDAGRFIGSDLFLAAVALNKGPEGNIREGNRLISDMRNPYIDPEIAFYNPGPGTGGAYRERLESARRRFIEDMDKSYTAVTENDYEQLVLTTPGLCIHKAHARMDESRNFVRIAVKQGTDEEFPKLSSMYEKLIRDRLELRRLLTTRIELVSPVYMPVNVSATVYVKPHFENVKETIEEAIRRKTDYLNSEKSFGEPLKFDEVFHAIESLECVEYVYELSLRPQSLAGARMRDADVVPDENCLLYPGHIRIETLSFDDETN